MSMLFAIRSNDFFGSGLHPFHSAGLHPFHSAGLHPFHSAGLHPFHSTALHPFHSATSPDGYVGPSAMLVEALRTVRADLASSEPLPGPHTKFDGRFTLWRWDPKPRQEACLFDLMSRLQFDKGCMWHLPDGNPPASKSGRPAEKAFEVITITPPGDGVLDEQVQLVLKRSRDRGDRLAEILVQAEDVWPFWSAVTNLMPAAIPFTCELIELGRRFVTTVVMRFKHDIACLRPASISPHVQPVIPTPGHGSLPSGHATDAYFVASLLRELLPGPSYERVDVQMRRLAYRIADNRVVAGLHFPMDSVAGCLLGDTLAAYFASACTGKSGNICGARFEGKKLAAGSATGPLMLDEKNGYEAFKAFAAKGGAETCGNPSDLLKRMWTSALNELHALGYTD